MKDSTAISIGSAVVAGVAVYLLWRMMSKPLTKEQASASLRNAGARVRETPTGTYADVGREFGSGGQNVTVTLTEGMRLNLAQKMIIGIDRFVPGSWLTRLVLT